MNLNDHSDAIEIKIVNNENGWGQTITYTKRSDNSVSTPKAMCQDEIGKMGKNDTVQDEAVFYSVVLEFKPLKGDTISWNDILWEVERSTGDGIYDIWAINSKKTASRSGRK